MKNYDEKDLNAENKFDEEKSTVNEDEKKKNEEYDLIAIKRDSRNIRFGLNLPKEITMINIKNLTNRGRDFSPYDYLNEEDTLLMKSSLERCGIIQPFIVYKLSNGYYMIVDGENRAACLCEMFHETCDTKYENVPCIVLTEENFSYLDLKEICINANLNKKCNFTTKLKVILTMVQIYRTRYVRLKDINVAREISGKLGISVSTVYNYLKLQNLCVKGLKFLNSGRIDLTSAGLLSNLSSELQELIINEIGEKNICNHVIKNAVNKKTNLENYKSQIEKAFSLKYPSKYSIKITGEYKKMEIIEKMLDDYFDFNSDELSDSITMTTCNKYFDFSIGHDCLYEKQMYIPEYFQKFIENGEVGEVIPDSELKNDINFIKKEIEEDFKAQKNMSTSKYKQWLESKKRKDK